MPQSDPSAIGESLIQSVLLCKHYRRDSPGPRKKRTSRPGHLLHLSVEGEAHYEISGRQYRLKRGDLMWLHEVEEMRVWITRAPWSFYSLNVIAPGLEAPPFEKRAGAMSERVFTFFESARLAWSDTQADPLLRHLRAHGAVAQLLGAVLEDLEVSHGPKFRMDEGARLWWTLESRLRQDLSVPVHLTRMEELTGRSAATIARACQQAVGLPPMKRVKQIRMSMARELVRRSALRMVEISWRVGYQRQHEFSRDYRRYFGCAPREDRQGSL